MGEEEGGRVSEAYDLFRPRIKCAFFSSEIRDGMYIFTEHQHQFRYLTHGPLHFAPNPADQSIVLCTSLHLRYLACGLLNCSQGLAVANMAT